MRAAVEALRRQGPARIVVAVPVAAAVICNAFQAIVDEMVCAVTLAHFSAVGHWYEEFTPTTDQAVRALLARAPARRPAAPPPGGAGTAIA